MRYPSVQVPPYAFEKKLCKVFMPNDSERLTQFHLAARSTIEVGKVRTGVESLLQCLTQCEELFGWNVFWEQSKNSTWVKCLLERSSSSQIETFFFLKSHFKKKIVHCWGLWMNSWLIHICARSKTRLPFYFLSVCSCSVLLPERNQFSLA